MNRLSRTLSGAWLFAVALVVTLCVAPTLAHAAGRTVNLVATNGSLQQRTVTLDDGDRLPSTMPTASRTGWNFVGWWTEDVTWEWWNDPKGLEGRLDGPPEGYTTDPVTGRAYTFDGDYWTYIGKTSGRQVRAGDVVSGDTLYACFAPTHYTVKFHWNGWGNAYGALEAHRSYGTTTLLTHPTSWSGHTFTGWYTSPKAGQGSQYLGTEPVSGDLDLYAHYEGMASDPGAQRDSMIDARSIRVSPSKATIEPSGGKVDLSAELTMLSSTDVPSARDWSNVTWTIVDGANLAKLSASSGRSCTVTALDRGEGEVTVQASFLSESAKTVFSKATVTVKTHTHAYGAETVLVAPTCQRAGYGTQTCSICGDVKRNEHPKSEHVYKSVPKLATCTEDGYVDEVCSVCGDLASHTIVKAKGHDFDVRVVDSCTGRVETRTCKVCGSSETTETTEGSGTGSHSWERAYTVDKPATCGTPGSESIHCSNCGLKKDSREIAPTGTHAWGGWHTTKAATSDAKGEQERVCPICDKHETQEIPMLVGEPATTSPDATGQPGQDAGQQPEQPVQPVRKQPLYRLYNDETGDHCYTSDPAERTRLIDGGYRTETMKGATALPATSETPVYRLDNPWTGEHHYTTSFNEYGTLCALGWSGKGTAFYSADPGSGVKVYRLFNPFAEGTAAAHHYTTDTNEVSTLQGLGYRLDGEPGWYYLPA